MGRVGGGEWGKYGPNDEENAKHLSNVGRERGKCWAVDEVGANHWCCCCCLLSCLTIWFLVAHFQFVSVESQFKAWVRVGWISDDEPQFQALAAIKQAIVALVGDLPHCSISRCQFGHIAFPSFKRC